MKCDEVHPKCGNCVRVDSECIYPDPYNRNRPRKKLAASSKTTRPDVISADRTLPSLTTSPQQTTSESPLAQSEGLDLLFANVFTDANTLVHGIADFGALEPAQTQPPMNNLKPFHLQIILNGNGDNFSIDESEISSYLIDSAGWGSTQQMWDQFDSQMSFPAEKLSGTSNNELFNKIVEIYNLNDLEKLYFSRVIQGKLLFFIFPFAPTVEDNAVMHVFLEYCTVFKYLVYAIIATSASMEFTVTKDAMHDRNQKKYLSICMRLLVAAFADLKSKVNSLWHIEGLILTVLLLTMMFCDMSFLDTDSVPVSWVSHLREARSLLVKYDSLKLQGHPQKIDSFGIVIAKMLFFSYEWISKLSRPMLEVTREDLDELLELMGKAKFTGSANSEYAETLRHLQVILPPLATHTGFSLFISLTTEVMDAVFELLKAVADANSRRAHQTPVTALLHVMGIISKCSKQQIIPGAVVSNKYFISKDNPGHPEYAGPDRLPYPMSVYGKDTDNLSGPEYYSWADLCQQLHANFLYLKVLTTRGLLHMHRSLPVIRSIVREVIDGMFFVRPKSSPMFTTELALAESKHFYLPKCLFDLRAIMIQLPYRMCIDLVDLDADFEKLELFFTGLLRLGSGNCVLAISRIQSKWKDAREQQSRPKTPHSDLEYLTEGFPTY